MNDKLTKEEMQSRCRELEGEALRLRESEKAALRQNEYLTALHETSVGLIPVGQEGAFRVCFKSSGITDRNGTRFYLSA